MDKLPILLIPGTLCTGAVFKRQANELAALAPQVKLVRFSHEDSMSDMADTAIDLISPYSTAAVIGFSMGGMVAMEILRKAPERIGKLALLNTNFHKDNVENRAARLLHLQQARAQGMETVIRQHYLDRYLHQTSPDIGNLIVDMACELGTTCFKAQTNALASRPDSSTTLQGIKCPTLVLGSEQDALCKPAVQKQMHVMITGSELVMLPDCGHFSMLEKPAEVSLALRNWYLQDQSL